MTELSVSMRGIVKRFGAFTALDGARLDVRPGSVHALLGENGAGKTTLMNVLYGLHPADEGSIEIHGTPVRIATPRDAIANGIGMVHQHFMLVGGFTAAQNIVLGAEPRSGLFMDTGRALRDAAELSEKYGLAIDPNVLAADMSVGMQQRVEILKALYRGAQILILDEPTAVLAPAEVADLEQMMRQFAADGKSVIIITHKLDEITRVADECTVLRRGKYIGTVCLPPTPKKGMEEELAAMMVGRPVDLHINASPANPGACVLDVRGLTVRGAHGRDAVREVDLTVRAGEIVGIAGVDGNGQRELAEAIMNLARATSGTISINGRQIQNATPGASIDAGVAVIHEDRLLRGIVPDMDCAENAALKDYFRAPCSNGRTMIRGAQEARVREFTAQYDIRPPECAALPARALSGGNQQKLIIARETAAQPALLIAMQPTRGIDVGAIELVRRLLIAQRDKGTAILLISYILDEVMEMSDRLAVMYGGRIVDMSPHGARSANEIGLLMAGGSLHTEGSAQ